MLCLNISPPLLIQLFKHLPDSLQSLLIEPLDPGLGLDRVRRAIEAMWHARDELMTDTRLANLLLKALRKALALHLQIIPLARVDEDVVRQGLEQLLVGDARAQKRRRQRRHVRRVQVRVVKEVGEDLGEPVIGPDIGRAPLRARMRVVGGRVPGHDGGDGQVPHIREVVVAARVRHVEALGDALRGEMGLQLERHGQGHVRAGREAGEHDPVRVDVERGGVLGQIEHRVGAVVDRGRERELWRQPVPDRDADRVRVLEHGAGPARVVQRGPDGEAAAVEAEHDRVGPLCLLVLEAGLVRRRHVEVQVQLARDGRDARLDPLAEGDRGRARPGHLVQEHADGHEEAPAHGFGVEIEA
jgi:hypothetical protein